MRDSEDGSASLAESHADLSQLFREPDRTSQEVVQSVFGLRHHETRAYLVLLEHPHSTAKHVADVLDRHQSHAARSLRGLHDADLAEREQQPLDTGSRAYVYTPVPVEEVKQYLQTRVDRWVAHLRDEIEQFGSDLDAEAGWPQPGSDG